MIEAPYGHWQSPITAEMTAFPLKSPRSTYIAVDGKEIYWTETRPFDGGRTVLIQCTAEGLLRDLTPSPFDVRSKVHEYGGLSFTISKGVVYFVNKADQCLYAQKSDEPLQKLSEAGYRLAEPLVTEQGIICICEVGVQNFLGLIDSETGAITRLDEGQDFYAAPTLHPEGSKLAWITWNHPQMPWDGTQLWVADFVNGQLSNKHVVAGSPQESIFQPQWSPRGILTYISDKNGWWNFYQVERGCIFALEAEFGLPLWGLGQSTWRFTGNAEHIICTYQQQGLGKMAFLDPLQGQLTPIDLPGTDFSQIAIGQGFAVFMEGSFDAPRRIIHLDLALLRTKTLDEPPSIAVETSFISQIEPLAFPTAQGKTAYAYYYSPHNSNYEAPKGSLPPLIVMSHGGPTASTDPVFNLRIHYWTSRGFAVLDVNYGGSTGYGREYRNRLKGQWGIVDVQDCCNGALYLAKSKQVDPQKLFIRGGSAGGYTTLAALAFTPTFAAGASYYGVGDLELLVKDTHKFEGHYLETLIGPYPASKQLYQARSPIHHAKQITCPVIFFQGGKDKIVPPNQAKTLFNALQKQGIRTELVIYPEEEHGFRQAENIKDSLERELKFYLFLA